MRTDSREMLAVGIFGSGSRLGDRIEALLARGRPFSIRVSPTGLVVTGVVLAGLATAASIVPRWIAFAQAQSGRAFEVVSIKPNNSASDQVDLARPKGNRLVATNVSLRMLVMRAFKVKEFELSGGPGWTNSSRFDVSATTGRPGITEPEFKTMLQALLADRFKLRTHRETRPMSIYLLTPIDGGPKLANPTGSCVEPQNLTPDTPGVICGGFLMNNDQLEGRRISMEQFAAALSNFLGRPVIDRTDYKGAFDLHLEFTFAGIAPLNGGGFGTPTLPASASDDDSKPTIFTAIEKQMGLKLESQKGTGEVLVIDHAEKPDAN